MADHRITMHVDATAVPEVRAVLEAALGLQECMPWMGDTWTDRVARLAAWEGPVGVSGPGLARLFHALELLSAVAPAHVLDGTACWCEPQVEVVPPAL